MSKATILATYTGPTQHTRRISVETQIKDLFVPEGETSDALVWTHGRSVNVTDVHPLVLDYLRRDPNFSLREIAPVQIEQAHEEVVEQVDVATYVPDPSDPEGTPEFPATEYENEPGAHDEAVVPDLTVDEDEAASPAKKGRSSNPKRG